MINPGGIPQYDGIPSEISAAAERLRSAGQSFADTGSAVHSSWQGLAPFYQAPESGQLFAATQPVSDRTGIVSTEIGQVADALVTFAETMVPIKWRLAELKTEAQLFVNSVAGDDDWADDEAKVDQHNALQTEVGQLVDQWQAAERDAANSINAAYGSAWRWEADNGDDNVDPHEYGFDADLYAQADEQGVELPWGNSEDVNPTWYQSVGNFFHGIVIDGAWGDIQGLGAFVGFQGWDAFAGAWTNVGVLATMLTPGGTVMALANPDLARRQQELLSGMWNGMIASDMWEDDPARAAGLVIWNFGSLLIPGAGAAAKVTKLGRVAEIAGRVAVTADRFTIASLTERFLATRPGLNTSFSRFSQMVDDGLDVTFRGDDAVPSTPRVDPAPTGNLDASLGRAGDVSRTTGGPSSPSSTLAETPGNTSVGSRPEHGGAAYQAFETPHSYSDGAHTVGPANPPLDWSHMTSRERGLWGEALTRADLERQGYEVLIEQPQVVLPSGSHFVPDFVVRGPDGNTYLVESKFGPGASYTAGQREGYAYADGNNLLDGRGERSQIELENNGVTTVDGVLTYRWNTEVVPDETLIADARALMDGNPHLQSLVP